MKKRNMAVGMAVLMAAAALGGCQGAKQAETMAAAAAAPETEAASQAEKQETEKADASLAQGQSITFWHSMGGVNGEALEALVKKFNDENELGIKVEAQFQGAYDDAINKLKSAQIGNMGADLVQIYDIGTRFMIDSGWVVPMQELIDQDGWDLSQIEPNIAAYYTVGDTLYSMPFNSSTPILYYTRTCLSRQV